MNATTRTAHTVLHTTSIIIVCGRTEPTDKHNQPLTEKRKRKKTNAEEVVLSKEQLRYPTRVWYSYSMNQINIFQLGVAVCRLLSQSLRLCLSFCLSKFSLHQPSPRKSKLLPPYHPPVITRVLSVP